MRDASGKANRVSSPYARARAPAPHLRTRGHREATPKLRPNNLRAGRRGEIELATRRLGIDLRIQEIKPVAIAL